MEKTCGTYTFEQINCFIDNELPDETYQEIKLHCQSCEICRRTIENLNAVSAVFNKKINERVSAMNPASMKERVEIAMQQEEKSRFSDMVGLFGKNIYLKLASITAILIVGLYMFNGKVPVSSGPSAIVNYIDTELPSVMIIETQEQKHTIIWFSET